jgi:hypothetical protein
MIVDFLVPSWNRLDHIRHFAARLEVTSEIAGLSYRLFTTEPEFNSDDLADYNYTNDAWSRGVALNILLDTYYQSNNDEDCDYVCICDNDVVLSPQLFDEDELYHFNVLGGFEIYLDLNSLPSGEINETWFTEVFGLPVNPGSAIYDQKRRYRGCIITDSELMIDAYMFERGRTGRMVLEFDKWGCEDIALCCLVGKLADDWSKPSQYINNAWRHIYHREQDTKFDGINSHNNKALNEYCNELDMALKI